MNELAIWPEATIGLISAITVVILTQVISKWRSDRQLQKTERVRFLIEAYKAIEKSALRDSPLDIVEFESAVASVHLLGDKENVKAVERVFELARESRTVDVEELLISLRASLRKELRLSPVPEKFSTLRLR